MDKSWKSLIHQSKRLKQRLHWPLILAFALALVITSTHMFEYFEDPKWIKIFGSILGLLLITVAFEVHEATVKKYLTPRRIEKLTQSHETLFHWIDDHAKSNDRIRIRWLGITYTNVGQTIRDLSEYLAPTHKVELELVYLREWLGKNDISGAMTPLATDVSLNAFKQIDTCTLKTTEYSHMPQLHGGLIDVLPANGGSNVPKKRLLLLGLARWENGQLKAGDRSFHLYEEGRSNEDNEMIQVFEGWLEFCMEGSKLPRPRP